MPNTPFVTLQTVTLHLVITDEDTGASVTCTRSTATSSLLSRLSNTHLSDARAQDCTQCVRMFEMLMRKAT